MRRAALILFALLAGDSALGSSAEAVAAAARHAATLPPDKALHTRYLTDYAVPAGAARAAFAKVLAFHVNSLSREGELVAPAVVAPALYALDLRDYGWDAKVWEKLAEADPYFHARTKITKTVIEDEVWAGGVDSRDGKYYAAGTYKVERKKEVITAALTDYPGMAALAKYTGSQAPLLRADWFFAQTAISEGRAGTGYYDFLAIKKEGDLEALSGIDRKKAAKARKEIAAIIANSGVALNNRQVFRVAEGYWETRDPDSSTGKSNALTQLDGDFVHVAREVYFRLPCGLWGLAAVNAADGTLQKTVPDKVAADHTTTSNDHRIHAGLSCVRCHLEGLRPLDDWAREFYKVPPGDALLQSPDYEKLKRLRQLYLSDLLGVYYEVDQLVYARTLARVTGGMKPAELARAYGAAWKAYTDDLVTGEQFARELGTTRAEMVKAFAAVARAQGSLDPVLVGFMKRPEFRARREHVEESFGVAALAVRGLFVQP